MKRNNIEEQIAIAFIARLEQYYTDIADVTAHIPNENKGYQHKNIGIKKGWPDYCVAIRTKEYGALYVELKAPKGRLSEDQKRVHALLEKNGNKVVTCYSWQDAIEQVEIYISQNS